jgi:hypothetical protein
VLRAQGLSGNPGLDLGNGAGNPSAPIGQPFQFIIDPARNPIESQIQLVATALTANGQTLATSAPVDLRVDNLPPRLTVQKLASEGFANEEFAYTGLQLGHQTGPYPAQSIINVSRLSGGGFVNSHTGCSGVHGHGTISIRDFITGATLGPFGDPEFSTGDPCGHGLSVSVNSATVAFALGGAIVEASPLSKANLLLYRAVGSEGCDAITLVNDVLVSAGSASGNVSPSNTLNVLPNAGNFLANFTIAGDATFQPGVFCIRREMSDGALPTPNTLTGTALQFNLRH